MINRLKVFALFSIILLFGISCEDDFTNLGGDFVNNLELPEPYVVQNLSAYSENILSVQSNALSNYLIGEFEDPVFGNTKTSILTQLRIQNTNPDFGQNPVVDSVILTLPFFSQIISSDPETEIDTYRLDSVYGNGAIKFGIYESNQFLRDIDPGEDGEFDEDQIYYSDQLSDFQSNILDSDPLTVSIDEDGNIVPSDFSPVITPSELNESIELYDYSQPIRTVNQQGDSIDSFVINKVSPRIRIKLDPEFFNDKIISQANSINLASQASFKNYFRSLYINVVPESENSEKCMMSFNLANTEANITMYYRSDRLQQSGEEDAQEELVETFNEFRLTFGDNIVNLHENSGGVDLSSQNTEQGEENIYIKGGQGVVAIINPFNGPDTDGNGVADEIDSLRTLNLLVNEANLILNINNDIATDQSQFPFRILAYDIDRERVLIDYNLDQTAGNNFFTSRRNHLGPLTEEDGNFSYKIRLTSHINNIINNDSTNTKIGIVVIQNVNQSRPLNVKQSQLGQVNRYIEGALTTPRSAVFHGNLSDNEEKRLKLQIFYTDPNSN